MSKKRKNKADYTPEEWAARLERQRARYATPEGRARSAEYNRKYLYGLQRGEYERMYQLQDGKCYACGRSGQKLSVDHCHDSGLVRALLCKTCNTWEGVLATLDIDPELWAQRIKRLRNDQATGRAIAA